MRKSQEVNWAQRCRMLKSPEKDSRAVRGSTRRSLVTAPRTGAGEEQAWTASALSRALSHVQS